MDAQTLLLKWGLRTRIVHRLPGRLRVEIAALRKIPVEKRELVRTIVDGAILPHGVTSLEPSFVTGSVVLTYDPQVITEQQVLIAIREISHAVLEHREELWRIGRQNLPVAMERLNGVLSKAHGTTGRTSERGC
jgi:hypothetical protein